MTLEDRVKRLERSFLIFAAILTGEAQKEANSPEEFAAVQQQLGEDMTAMKDQL